MTIANLLYKLSESPNSIITQIAWSPDGKLLAIGFNGIPKISIWDIEKREHFYNLVGNEQITTSLVWLSNTDLIAGYAEGTIRIWNVKKEETFKRANAHSSAVYKLFLVGAELFSVGYDGKICSWNLLTDNFLPTIKFGNISAGSYLWGESEFIIANGKDVWQYTSDGTKIDKKGMQSAISTYVACSFDGKQAAVGSEDGSIRLWDLEIERERKFVNEHKSKIIYIEYFSDNKFFLSKSSDGVVHIINCETRKSVLKYEHLTAQYAVGLAIHPQEPNTIALLESPNTIAAYQLDFTDQQDKPLDLKTKPKPPEELIKSCFANETILYAGLGFSAIAGYPVWKDFVSGLLKRSIENGLIKNEPLLIRSFETSIEQENLDSVADHLASKLNSEILFGYLQGTFLRNNELTQAHKLLREIPFLGVATANFDKLLEKTYGYELDNNASKKIYTYNDAEFLKTALAKQEFFILKTYGDVTVPGTPIISAAQYKMLLKNNSILRRFFENIMASKTLLFIGCSMRGVEIIVEELSPSSFGAKKHFALVGTKDNTWLSNAELLKRRYNIEVIPYWANNGEVEITEFLQILVDEIKKLNSLPTTPVNQINYLKKVHLENIGPFEQLDINLDKNLTIFLGDNGVGKTSVLKAIALAICGKGAENFAERLIKSGKTNSRIILETNADKSYTTDIQKTSSAPEIKSIPGTLLDLEKWLVSGFSPLRFISSNKPTSAETKIETMPVLSDVLPLINGLIDPRMDGLKQWIVNLDYWGAKSEEETEKEKGKFQIPVNS